MDLLLLIKNLIIIFFNLIIMKKNIVVETNLPDISAEAVLFLINTTEYSELVQMTFDFITYNKAQWVNK